jgi:hypothetical protein
MCTTTILNHSGKHFFITIWRKAKITEWEKRSERERVRSAPFCACEKDCDLSVASLREGASFFGYVDYTIWYQHIRVRRCKSHVVKRKILLYI